MVQYSSTESKFSSSFFGLMTLANVLSIKISGVTLHCGSQSFTITLNVLKPWFKSKLQCMLPTMTVRQSFI